MYVISINKCWTNSYWKLLISMWFMYITSMVSRPTHQFGILDVQLCSFMSFINKSAQDSRYILKSACLYWPVYNTRKDVLWSSSFIFKCKWSHCDILWQTRTLFWVLNGLYTAQYCNITKYNNSQFGVLKVAPWWSPLKLNGKDNQWDIVRGPLSFPLYGSIKDFILLSSLINHVQRRVLFTFLLHRVQKRV